MARLEIRRTEVQRVLRADDEARCVAGTVVSMVGPILAQQERAAAAAQLWRATPLLEAKADSNASGGSSQLVRESNEEQWADRSA